MVIRISDKTQNYSKVTKLLVKPKENHYLIDLNTNLFDDFLEAWIQKKPI